MVSFLSNAMNTRATHTRSWIVLNLNVKSRNKIQTAKIDHANFCMQNIKQNNSPAILSPFPTHETLYCGHILLDLCMSGFAAWNTTSGILSKLCTWWAACVHYIPHLKVHRRLHRTGFMLDRIMQLMEQQLQAPQYQQAKPESMVTTTDSIKVTWLTHALSVGQKGT